VWPKPSGKPGWGVAKDDWEDEDCETKTYDSLVTDTITKTVTKSKDGDSWPEETTVTVTSTKKVTVTIPKSKPAQTSYYSKPYEPKPETWSKQDTPDVPKLPESPYVPKPASYTKVPVVTANAVPSYKPSGYYVHPVASAATTTKGYKPLQATANAAVQNGVAGVGVLAAALLALF
jgi:hypothetical protein